MQLLANMLADETVESHCIVESCNYQISKKVRMYSKGPKARCWTVSWNRGLNRTVSSGFTLHAQLVFTPERVRPTWRSGSKWDKARALFWANQKLFFPSLFPRTKTLQCLVQNLGPLWENKSWKNCNLCFFSLLRAWRTVAVLVGRSFRPSSCPSPCLSSMSAARPNGFQLHADDGAKDTHGKDELFPRSSLTKKKTGFERQRDHACSSIIGLCLSLSHHEIICRGGGRSLRARLLNRVSSGPRRDATPVPSRLLAADLIIWWR